MSFSQTKNKIGFLIIFVLSILAVPVFAYVSNSPNYQMDEDSINAGGGYSASGSYQIMDTLGDISLDGVSSNLYSTIEIESIGGVQPSVCNLNGVCEAVLGETESTCPNDCRVSPSSSGGGGGGIPSLFEGGGELSPELIVISDLEIGIEGNNVIISWKTNRDTNTSLVFDRAVGGEEEVYLDEFFRREHFVELKNLVLKEDVYFRIFSEDSFGKNNYDYAKLYAIRVTTEEVFDEAEKVFEDALVKYDAIVDNRTNFICKLPWPLSEMTPSETVCKISPPKTELEKKREVRPIYYDDHFLYDWGYAFKQFLYKIRLIGSNSIFRFLGKNNVREGYF